MKPLGALTRDNFDQHVWKPHGPTACWEWLQARNPAGYGQKKSEGAKALAHRLAYALFGLSTCPRAR